MRYPNSIATLGDETMTPKGDQARIKRPNIRNATRTPHPFHSTHYPKPEPKQDKWG